jgi:uncharacterized protein (DUF2252 family)
MATSSKAHTKSFKTALNPRPTIKERIAQGKAIRKEVPRSSHAKYQVLDTRKDPIQTLLDQDKDRLQDLVPVRHARMLQSPFAFLRGSAKIMIDDIGMAPTTKIPVLANGDIHVSNFGIYATAERNLVFSINDFDETHPGAWEWDMKRLTASAVVCARFLGGDKASCAEAVHAVVSSYRLRMKEFSEKSFLDLWYETIKVEDVLQTLSSKAKKSMKEIISAAQKRSQLDLFEKMSHTVNDRLEIKSKGPLLMREDQLTSHKETLALLDQIFQTYKESLSSDKQNLVERYQILDLARKVVGVGSVGTRCWVILLKGSDNSDPLFLQVKQADVSVMAAYSHAPLPYANQGRRVVSGQRTVQGAPDIFLGWGDYQGTDFYIRQLSDMKGGMEFIPGTTKISNFIEYCRTCGWALALAHAKSGDAATLWGYCGDSAELDAAFTKFAFAYADQTQLDFEEMQMAAKTGRIAVAKDF